MPSIRLAAIAAVAAIALGGHAPVHAQMISTTIEVATDRAFVPLHSYVHGRTGSSLLIFGGLADMGLHFFGNNAFPVNNFSTEIHVVDEATGTVYSGGIGHLNGATRRALRVTAAQAVQFDSTLYIYGGYGPLNTNKDFNTRGTVLAIDLPQVEAAIIAGDPVPQGAFTVSACPVGRVTGGGIIKFSDGNRFALICGADMPGAYGGGNEPIYTHKVYIFDRTVSMTVPVHTIDDGEPFDGPLYRRDINALPVTLPDGGGVRDGFVVVCGVFQGGIFAWENPVMWGDGDSEVFVDTTFTQHMGAYEGPVASLYSASRNTNHMLIYAGLSGHNYVGGQFVWNPATPWTSEATQMQMVDGVFMSETVIGEMPWPLTNAHLVLERTLPVNALGQVLVDDLPANQPILLGRIYGGLAAEMPADSPPTHGSDEVYNVFITIQGQAGQPAALEDFTVNLGYLQSGGVAEASTSDDTYLITRSQYGFNAAEANVTRITFGLTTGVGSPQALDLIVESRINNPSGNVRLSLKTWADGLFTQVHSYSIGTAETTERVDDVPAAGRVRVADGRIELRVHQAVIATFSLAGFDSRFDLVSVEVR